MTAGAASWAREEFGKAQLGDVRRTRRLVAMATRAAGRSSGKVSAVFDRAREREGAYDFLESPHVEAAALANSVFATSCERIGAGAEHVYVSVDGSCLTLTDEREEKFGPVGSPNKPTRGLLVMSAFAVAGDGVPIGLIDQFFWTRPPFEKLTTAERRERNRRRVFDDKETAHYLTAAKNAAARLEQQGVRPWFVIDRDGDNRGILLGLHRLRCLFTVRAKWDRRVWPRNSGSVHEALDEEPALGTFDVEIGRTGQRAARRATLEVRASQVTLRFVADCVQPTDGLRLYAVRIREVNAPGEPLEWLLYTNVPVFSAEHAKAILDSYRARWRIEEFHRTWKQGHCNVEQAQLRSSDAMIKWATILAAVATRIERLKYLSRETPDVPASRELSEEEIEALRLDQRRRKGKRRKLPSMPTIVQATEWIGELGGWIGPRNGRPGATTLARGLERLGYLIEGIRIARGVAPASTWT
jgi:transposase-like protein/DDE family transposase